MHRQTASLILAAASLWGASAHRIPAGTEPDSLLRRAVVAGDINMMKTALEAGADPNTRDADGTPVLMNAALYGTAAHMKLLIDHGADVNARNLGGATALLWGAGDAAMARMLVAKGADVNAVSNMGRTPLMAAASVAGNSATVALLLDKGADVNARDTVMPIPVLPVGGGKGTALIDAARTGDVEMARLLMARGADPHATDSRNGTALSEAVVMGHREMVRMLLAAGAKPSGAVTLLKTPYLSLAVLSGSVDIARQLVATGANVNGADVAGHTPLMLAAGDERAGAVEMLEFLLSAGARVDAANKAGETAMDFAARRGETAQVRLLRKAGSPEAKAARVYKGGDAMPASTTSEGAIEAALAVLAKSAPVAMKKGGCGSCHSHTLPVMAFGAARRAGMKVDESHPETMVKYVTATMGGFTTALLEGSDTMPDLPVTGGYILDAFQEQGVGPNRMTAAIVERLMRTQQQDGRWAGWAPRAPMEAGDIQATALAIRALTAHPIPGRQAEISKQVAAARMWLRLNARPVTTEDHAMRVMGLIWGGSRPAKVAQAARQLASLQRADGGWAQLPGLQSDAYATGKAMVALMRAFPKPVFNPARMDEAERFLRRMQYADGSWHAKTRAIALQPLVDVDFPHGRDQWISAAATSWAATALAMRQTRR